MFSNAILKLDLLCDGNTVVGDQRSAELLVEDNVSALRSESDLNRICELIYACEKSGSCICAVKNILSHCKSPPDYYSTIARMSL